MFNTLKSAFPNYSWHDCSNMENDKSFHKMLAMAHVNPNMIFFIDHTMINPEIQESLMAMNTISNSIRGFADRTNYRYTIFHKDNYHSYISPLTIDNIIRDIRMDLNNLDDDECPICVEKITEWGPKCQECGRASCHRCWKNGRFIICPFCRTAYPFVIG